MEDLMKWGVRSFPTSHFHMQAPWILSCSCLWYLACHFVLQHWDFSPQKVGQAVVVGWYLDLLTRYRVFAKCRTEEISQRAHKDTRMQWDGGQLSSLAVAEAAQKNLIVGCVMVDCIKTFLLLRLPCNSCPMASGIGVISSYVTSMWHET